MGNVSLRSRTCVSGVIEFSISTLGFHVTLLRSLVLIYTGQGEKGK